jgi:threonylcarbamoyladenosine tRNA methylthiotransferase MtaB
MKYAVVTFGCRVNQADSLGFEEQLLAAGARPSPPEHADVVIVNTCSVTATADQGARQTIRRVSRDNPSARIVVTGCYATRRPEDVAGLPNVVRVVDNSRKANVVPLIVRTSRSELTTAERFGAGDGACGAALEPGVAGRTAFTLRVQTGCAEACSYCIIPKTRGTPLSVPVADIRREIERIVSAGFKEIVITGVHLGSYGRDLVPTTSLATLLRTLDACAQPHDVLFRVSSLEPMDCTPEIVDIVAGSPRFAPHFHLPLQHGSETILSAMRRPYTLDYYATVVNDIRRRMPDASIGSDVIVGFPGETEDDAAALECYVEGSPLTHLHVFPYSDRPGTSAAALKPKVSGSAVRDRARRIREAGHRLTRRFRQAQIGTVHRALTLDDGASVVTSNYLKLGIPPGRMRNEWVMVRVVGYDTGEVLSSGLNANVASC